MSRPRRIPDIQGFQALPVSPQYTGGLRHCWVLSYQGGRMEDVVEWLKANRPSLKRRVTAVIYAECSTWVTDVCEENVRITHFRPYSGWMSERMKLWWRLRKAGEVAI